MTLAALVDRLRCPECSGPLAFAPAPQPDGLAGACGVLRCGCAAYPVLDGIPILRRGPLAHRSIGDDRVVAGGPTTAAVVARVEAGRAADALVELLSFPVCPWPLNRVGALRRLSLRGPLRRAGLAWRRRRVRRMLARRDALTAEDWLRELYWHAPAPFDPFNYFLFRFGQPRHLATLGVLAAVPPSEAPLLELMCGYGHFLHTVTAGGQAAIGLDQNVHQLWVARRYVAPGAALVCADAARPLPFADGAVGAVLCADAFYYLRDKAAAVREVERVATGPLVLASLRNARVGAPEAEALPPEGYTALLGRWSWAAWTEADVLDAYLARSTPDLSASSSDLGGHAWLYVLATRDAPAAPARWDVWPHAAGTPALNPLYERTGGRAELRMPSPWYAAENAGLRRYLPASVAPDTDDPLVSVGVPPAYLSPGGRPRTFAANRWLLSRLAREPSPLTDSPSA